MRVQKRRVVIYAHFDKNCMTIQIVICLSVFSFFLSVAYSTNRLVFNWRPVAPVRRNPDLQLPQFTVDNVGTADCTTDNGFNEGTVYIVGVAFTDGCISREIKQTWLRNILSIQINISKLPS